MDGWREVGRGVSGASLRPPEGGRPENPGSMEAGPPCAGHVARALQASPPPSPARGAGATSLSAETRMLQVSYWELPRDPKQVTTPFWVLAAFSFQISSIYLRGRGRERESEHRSRDRGRSRPPPIRESYLGLDPRTWRSEPELKADA